MKKIENPMKGVAINFIRIIIILFLPYPLSAHPSNNQIIIAQVPIMSIALGISFILKAVVLKMFKKIFKYKLLFFLSLGESVIFLIIMKIFLVFRLFGIYFYSYFVFLFLFFIINYFYHLITFLLLKLHIDSKKYLFLFTLESTYLIAYITVFFISSYFELFGWSL